MSDKGILTNQKWLFRGIGNLEDGRKVIRQIMEMDKNDRPEAIIAGSDEVAAGMVMEAAKVGLRIPEDLAIMGVDDQPLATFLQIPLTTIRQPVQEEGKLAAREMVRQLTGDFEDAVRTELDLELVIRQSA